MPAGLLAELVSALEGASMSSGTAHPDLRRHEGIGHVAAVTLP